MKTEEQPKVEEPKVEEVKTEAPKVEEVKTEEVKAEEQAATDNPYAALGRQETGERLYEKLSDLEGILRDRRERGLADELNELKSGFIHYRPDNPQSKEELIEQSAANYKQAVEQADAFLNKQFHHTLTYVREFIQEDYLDLSSIKPLLDRARDVADVDREDLREDLRKIEEEEEEQRQWEKSRRETPRFTDQEIGELDRKRVSTELRDMLSDLRSALQENGENALDEELSRAQESLTSFEFDRDPDNIYAIPPARFPLANLGAAIQQTDGILHKTLADGRTVFQYAQENHLLNPSFDKVMDRGKVLCGLPTRQEAQEEERRERERKEEAERARKEQEERERQAQEERDRIAQERERQREQERAEDERRRQEWQEQREEEAREREAKARPLSQEQLNSLSLHDVAAGLEDRLFDFSAELNEKDRYALQENQHTEIQKQLDDVRDRVLQLSLRDKPKAEAQLLEDLKNLRDAVMADEGLKQMVGENHLFGASFDQLIERYGVEVAAEQEREAQRPDHYWRDAAARQHRDAMEKAFAPRETVALEDARLYLATSLALDQLDVGPRASQETVQRALEEKRSQILEDPIFQKVTENQSWRDIRDLCGTYDSDLKFTGHNSESLNQEYQMKLARQLREDELKTLNKMFQEEEFDAQAASQHMANIMALHDASLGAFHAGLPQPVFDAGGEPGGKRSLNVDATIQGWTKVAESRDRYAQNDEFKWITSNRSKEQFAEMFGGYDPETKTFKPIGIQDVRENYSYWGKKHSDQHPVNEGVRWQADEEHPYDAKEEAEAVLDYWLEQLGEEFADPSRTDVGFVKRDLARILAMQEILLDENYCVSLDMSELSDAFQERIQKYEADPAFQEVTNKSAQELAEMFTKTTDGVRQLRRPEEIASTCHDGMDAVLGDQLYAQRLEKMKQSGEYEKRLQELNHGCRDAYWLKPEARRNRAIANIVATYNVYFGSYEQNKDLQNLPEDQRIEKMTEGLLKSKSFYTLTANQNFLRCMYNGMATDLVNLVNSRQLEPEDELPEIPKVEEPPVEEKKDGEEKKNEEPKVQEQEKVDPQKLVDGMILQLGSLERHLDDHHEQDAAKEVKILQNRLQKYYLRDPSDEESFVEDIQANLVTVLADIRAFMGTKLNKDQTVGQYGLDNKLLNPKFDQQLAQVKDLLAPDVKNPLWDDPQGAHEEPQKGPDPENYQYLKKDIPQAQEVQEEPEDQEAQEDQPQGGGKFAQAKEEERQRLADQVYGALSSLASQLRQAGQEQMSQEADDLQQRVHHYNMEDPGKEALAKDPVANLSKVMDDTQAFMAKELPNGKTVAEYAHAKKLLSVHTVQRLKDLSDGDPIYGYDADKTAEKVGEKLELLKDLLEAAGSNELAKEAENLQWRAENYTVEGPESNRPAKDPGANLQKTLEDVQTLLDKRMPDNNNNNNQTVREWLRESNEMLSPDLDKLMERCKEINAEGIYNRLGRDKNAQAAAQRVSLGGDNSAARWIESYKKELKDHPQEVRKQPGYPASYVARIMAARELSNSTRGKASTLNQPMEAHNIERRAAELLANPQFAGFVKLVSGPKYLDKVEAVFKKTHSHGGELDDLFRSYLAKLPAGKLPNHDPMLKRWMPTVKQRVEGLQAWAADRQKKHEDVYKEGAEIMALRRAAGVQRGGKGLDRPVPLYGEDCKFKLGPTVEYNAGQDQFRQAFDQINGKKFILSGHGGQMIENVNVKLTQQAAPGEANVEKAGEALRKP